MSRPLKLALTETRNAFSEMPATLDELGSLSTRLDEIREANVEHHVSLARQAASVGVQAIGFGELFTAPYFALSRDPMWHGLAESADDGPTVARLSSVANELSMVIVAPIYELDSGNGKRYNTAVVIDADGQRLGKYRKTHIPEGENEQGAFHEPFYFGRAEDGPFFPVFETAVGRLGVAICYDRHFEGVVRTLKKNGAELIFAPAVTFGEKSERMWEIEFEVDAGRNDVFIAGSNRIGMEAPYNQTFFGRSYVAGPDGRAVSDRYYHGLVVATIDLDAVGGTDPSGWNLLRDRRPDIYMP